MLLDFLPDAFQQIVISWFLLYCAYKFGERRIRWTSDRRDCNVDKFYQRLVWLNVLAVAILYAEAIFLETFVMDSQKDDAKRAPNKTAKWLEQHNDFFWFVLSVHQSVSLGIMGYELTSESKVKSFILLGSVPVFVQWIIGLFAIELITGAVAGLIFEGVTPLLLLVYGFQICFGSHKERATYAFTATFSYIISALPVFFLGTQMQSPHHALFLTVFFGLLSFFCWARAVCKTPKANPVLGLEFVKMERGERAKNKGDTATHVQPPKLTEELEATFSIDGESKDT
jgi:hypothetical protein